MTAVALSARVFFYVTFALMCVFLLSSKDWVEQFFPLSPSIQTKHTVPTHADSIYNITLGFQQIFAIIPPEQLEQKIRLNKAASETNIDLTILEGTKDNEFGGGEKSNRCHLNCAFEQMSLWRRIVDEQVSSALLMSSNAAWDTQIRSQLLGFRDAAKSLTNYCANASLQHGPYGNDWDLLWLGHCGKNSEGFHYSTNDATEVPHTLIWTAPDGRPLGYLYASTDIRLTSDNPVGELCLSSYAVSYRGAKKLLSLAEDWRGLMDQYVMERCQDGDLKCVIQWPHIMSQVDVGSKSVELNEELRVM